MLPGAARLQDTPLDVAAVQAEILDAAGGRAGAVVTFTGVVRADAFEDDRVASLWFEAYPEMAVAELERLRVEAGTRFGLVACAVRHRVGAVGVGEAIVAVVAAGPHRAEAFAAAGWVMDEIKRRVPIWKRAADRTGRSAWVENPR